MKRVSPLGCRRAMHKNQLLGALPPMRKVLSAENLKANPVLCLS